MIDDYGPPPHNNKNILSPCMDIYRSYQSSAQGFTAIQVFTDPDPALQVGHDKDTITGCAGGRTVEKELRHGRPNCSERRSGR